MKALRFMTLTVMVFFLLGCGTPTGEKASQYNFKQGISELKIKFLDNAPPEKIYPNSNFKMVVKLDNQAAYPVNNGMLRIVGVDDKFFMIGPLEQTFDNLQGRSLLSPAGDKKFLEFDGRSGRLFQNAERYRGDYFLKAKYSSTMEFSDTVCINPKLYHAYDSGCKVDDKKSYSGQGAPLAVTGIEEIIYPLGTGAKAEFRIQLKNRGRGEVDFIRLKSAKLGGKDFQLCEFQGPVIDIHKALLKKDRQEALLICGSVLRDQSSYTTTLTLDFSYDYELKEQHSLNLVR